MTKPAAMPATLAIGPFSVDVQIRTPLEMERAECEGRFHAGSCLIELRDDRCLRTTQDTLLHEALHATLQLHGIRPMLGLDILAEEQLVSGLTPALLALLRDNPDLVAHLCAGE